MNKHVTSLELSRKLDAAGIEQESHFQWEPWQDDYHLVAYEKQEIKLAKKIPIELYSAFLASELLEMLPEGVEGYKLLVFKKNGKWNIGYEFHPAGINAVYLNKSLPEAAGEMVLWCKENGHL